MPIGFANPALYDAAANAYGTDFNDITSGNNDMTGTQPRAVWTPPARATTWRPGSAPRTARRSPSRCAPTRSRWPNPGAQCSAVRRPSSLQTPRRRHARATAVTYSATGLPTACRSTARPARSPARPKPARDLDRDRHRLRRRRHHRANHVLRGRSRAIRRCRACHSSASVPHDRRCRSPSRPGATRPRSRRSRSTLPRGLQLHAARARRSRSADCKVKHLRFTASLQHGDARAQR